jgi:hypothetical protein
MKLLRIYNNDRRVHVCFAQHVIFSNIEAQNTKEKQKKGLKKKLLENKRKNRNINV